MRPVKNFRGTKRSTIDAQGRQQRTRLKMSSEGKGQSEFSGQLRAKVARAQQPNGDIRSFPRIGMHALRRLWLAEIPAQLVQKRWEILARAGRGAAQSPRRFPITPGGTTEAQIDAAG